MVLRGAAASTAIGEGRGKVVSTGVPGRILKGCGCRAGEVDEVDAALPKDSLNNPPEHAAGRDAAAMSCREVQPLLSAYTDGHLDPELARTVDLHILCCQDCTRELRALQMEEKLIVEALTDVRPSDSRRGRVAQMCVEVHEKAAAMANSLPERGWAIFRWALSFIAVVLFVAFWFGHGGLLSINYGPATETFVQSALPLFWVNAGMFALSVLVLLEGRVLARLECYLSSRVGGEPVQEPSRLETVLLELAGVLGVVLTLIFHLAFVSA